MMKPSVLTALLLVAVLVLPAGAACQSLDFLVVQPGQPGDSAAAQPVMDALAAYLQQQLPDSSVAGSYYNRTEEALTAIDRDRPQWAIVSLGFFIEQNANLSMTPVASTRPAGAAEEQFYLLVAKEQDNDWRTLTGRVEGTMLFQDRAISRLLFALPPEKLPFALHGSFHPLKAVRKVLQGELAGVILDRPQFQALQTLSIMADLKAIHASSDLPAAPVVWFGLPNDRTLKLVQVLREMAADPGAADLLNLLRTTGFGPVDPRLADYRDLLP